MNRLSHKIIAACCAALLFITTFAPSAAAALNESLLGDGFRVTSWVDYTLTSGVVESDFYLNNTSDDAPKRCFAIEVDLSKPDVSILAGYGDGDADDWKYRTVRRHSTAAESIHKVDVIAGINGDFYNTSTGEPRGLLVMNGLQCHPVGKYSYFAILKDGTAVIRESTQSTADVVEAVGGGTRLVKNGVNVAPSTKREPRSAVGIKANGNVILFVGDGRQLKSVGNTYVEMANILIALGCVDALELDGGNSSLMITQRASDSDLVLRNIPSSGDERYVGSSLLVCKTNAATGTKITVSSKASSFAALQNTSDILILNGTTVRKAKANGVNFTYAKNSSGGIVRAAVTLATGMQISIESNGKVTETRTVIVPGDTDCDGIITAADARIALRASVGLETLSGATSNAASVDGSNGISAADARLILRASVNLDDPAKWM